MGTERVQRRRSMSVSLVKTSVIGRGLYVAEKAIVTVLEMCCRGRVSERKVKDSKKTGRVLGLECLFGDGVEYQIGSLTCG